MTHTTPPEACRILGVIPARLQSTRLPRKVLRSVAGRPLLAWVVESARSCPLFDQIMVAVDSDEVAALCRENSWPYQRTSPSLSSGTDRLFAVAERHPATIYVNIQGDEPLLTSAHFEALLRPFSDPVIQVTTLRVPCPLTERDDPNVVKVVTARDGRALYFSRATLPYRRDGADANPVWKHLGLYAYRAAALERFAALPPSPLEKIEQLEQLRLLENGIPLHVVEAPHDAKGVNTEEELQKAELELLARAREADAFARRSKTPECLG